MNAIAMVARCRLRQAALEDEPVDPDQASRGPISPGPFVDDHGEMPMFLPSVSEISEGP